MRKYLKYFLPLGLVALAIVAVATMIAVSAGKRPERRQEGPQAVLVDAIEARSRSLNYIVHSQGTVRPRTETTLVSEVAGKVVRVSPDFVAGGFFRAGEELLRIDPSDYETALKRAEANLASMHARLADEQARSDQALKDWRNLGREGEPPSLVLRLPQLEGARANVQAAEADVDKARRDLQRTRITVPYDGLVRDKRVDVGQYVAPGTQLGVTFAVDTAEIRLPLSSQDLAYLDLPSATDGEEHPFPDVQLFAEEGSRTLSWDAQIIRTEGVLDQESRVLYAVAQVMDPYGVLGRSEQDELRMGSFVRAEIQGRRVEDVVVLPRHTLRRGNTVLVANEDRELEVRDVVVARAEPRWVYISSGIEDGEWVVTTTLDAPIPGTRLAISGEDASTGSKGESTEDAETDEAAVAGVGDG